MGNWRHITKVASDSIAEALSEGLGDVVYHPHGAADVTNLRWLLRSPSELTTELDGEFSEVIGQRTVISVRTHDIAFVIQAGPNGEDRDELTVSGDTAEALGVASGTRFAVVEVSYDGHSFADLMLEEIPT